VLTNPVTLTSSVVAAALLLSSCSSSVPKNSSTSTPADQPVVTGVPAGDNAADIEFTDALIAQDQQGIELAAVVADRSSNSKVVAFAGATASARKSEIGILKVFQVQWNSDRDDPGGQPGGATAKGTVDQATVAKLHSLHGGAFETLWLQSMIGLDQAGIEAANAEISNGKNVDAVEVARQISQARRPEIDQMNRMLSA
jgi:uncharacterized protein (DUF305 family)